jgi:hypothetical protein
MLHNAEVLGDEPFNSIKIQEYSSGRWCQSEERDRTTTFAKAKPEVILLDDAREE